MFELIRSSHQNHQNVPIFTLENNTCTLLSIPAFRQWNICTSKNDDIMSLDICEYTSVSIDFEKK